MFQNVMTSESRIKKSMGQTKFFPYFPHFSKGYNILRVTGTGTLAKNVK
jgi:hypothetical protein